jgi:hypothetical protein
MFIILASCALARELIDVLPSDIIWFRGALSSHSDLFGFIGLCVLVTQARRKRLSSCLLPMDCWQQFLLALVHNLSSLRWVFIVWAHASSIFLILLVACICYHWNLLSWNNHLGYCRWEEGYFCSVAVLEFHRLSCRAPDGDYLWSQNQLSYMQLGLTTLYVRASFWSEFVWSSLSHN